MKTRFLLLWASLFIAVTLVSCDKEEGDGRFTDFEVPELTPQNTIRFTVWAEENDFAYIIINGGKIAVDWGDGTVTKDKEPGQGEFERMYFNHVYRRAGEYTVRIWSEEVTFVNISGLNKSFSDLRVGECPELKNAIFNTFVNSGTISLDGCPELESLDVGNWKHLESLSLGECSELVKLLVYTNPELTELDLGANTKLAEFTSSDCGIEELALPPSIINVDFRKSNVRSLNLEKHPNLRKLILPDNGSLENLGLEGCPALSVLDISGSRIEELDFSELTELVQINCARTGMQTVDVTGNKDLRVLDCSGLGLTDLDISSNGSLAALNCADNELAGLDVSSNPYLGVLYLNGNDLDAEALNAVFTALPPFAPGTRDTAPRPQQPEIKFFHNPGTEACDQSIITDKGWTVKIN